MTWIREEKKRRKEKEKLQCNGQNENQRLRPKEKQELMLEIKSWLLRRLNFRTSPCGLKACPLVSPAFTERTMEGKKTQEGEGREATNRLWWDNGAGLQGELLAERITGSSMGDM